MQRGRSGPWLEIQLRNHSSCRLCEAKEKQACLLLGDLGGGDMVTPKIVFCLLGEA